MAASIVQTAKGLSNLATVTAAFASPPTNGNVVVLCIAADDYNGTPNAGWNQRTGMEQQTYHGGYVWDRVQSGGGNSFQYTIGSATNSAWILLEISGLDAAYYDISAGKYEQFNGATIAGQAITPSAGERFMLAVNGASVNGDDFSGNLTGQTNGFTHVASSGPNAVGQPGTFDFISVASLAVTANGSTAYSSDAIYPDDCLSRSNMIISFKVAAAGGSAGVATGSGTAVATGKSEAKSTGAASGTGVAVAVGKSTAKANGAASGTGVAVASGRAVLKSDGVATGSGVAVATGQSTAKADGAASGTGVAVAAGASLAKASGSAAGTSTVVAGSGGGAGHKQWRALLTHRASFCTANEIEMSTTVGGSDITTAPNLIYSTQFNSSNYAAANMVDDSTATQWFSASASVGSQEYIGQNFGTNTDVQEIRLYVTDGGSYPSAVVIQYSDDGSNWTSTDSYAFDSSMLNQWNSFPVGGSPTSGSGVAAGTSTVVATGTAVKNADGAAAGTSTVAATGKAEAKSSGVATGSAVAVATGNEIRKVAGTASGSSAVEATGSALSQAAGSAAGTSTAVAGSLPAGGAAGTAYGTSLAEAVGQSIARASGEAFGVSSASANVIDIGWRPIPPIVDPWSPVEDDDSSWVPINVIAQEWKEAS